MLKVRSAEGHSQKGNKHLVSAIDLILTFLSTIDNKLFVGSIFEKSGDLTVSMAQEGPLCRSTAVLVR